MQDSAFATATEPKGSEMFHPHLVGEMHRHDGTMQMDEGAVASRRSREAEGGVQFVDGVCLWCGKGR